MLWSLSAWIRSGVMDIVFVACQVCDECWFPGLATIVRVRFLVTVGILLDVGPDPTHEDGAIVECILAEEFATPIFENANSWLIQDADAAVDKTLVPLMRLWIIEKQR